MEKQEKKKDKSMRSEINERQRRKKEIKGKERKFV